MGLTKVDRHGQEMSMKTSNWIAFGTIFFLLLSFKAIGQERPDTMGSPMTDQISDVEIYSTLIRDDNSISLSRKQFLTMAGALEDPTRLLIKFPGISTINDQANSVVYHGMPAQYHRWSLYGARILNPNHLGNAGTISDFPARSSGGVNMFSGQAIGNLEFNGNPSSKSLDAISASSDISLRDPYQNAVNTNFSLIGLEVGMDKINEEENSSVLLNYRYSTVGLLTTLGMDFGGEVINFQDITGKYSKDLENGDRFATYFSLGYDSNLKEPVSPSSPIEEHKDVLEIDYYSLNMVAGALYNREREDFHFKNTLNISFNSTGRTSVLPLSSNAALTDSEYDSDEVLFASRHDYMMDRNKWKLGFTFEPYLHIISLEKLYPNPEMGLPAVDELSRTALHILPSIYSIFDLNNYWSLSARIGAQGVISSTNIMDAMGQGELKYKRSYFSTSFRYSRVAQLFEPEILIYELEPDFIQSDNFEINASYKGLAVSGFLHRVSNLPVSTSYYGFSAFENLDNLPIPFEAEPLDILAQGRSDIYGISISLVKNIGGVSVMSNLTIMDSEHDDLEQRSKAPLDYGHIFNLNLTKNWELGNEKEFGISASLHHRGGGRQNAVNGWGSYSWGHTNYSYESNFATRLADYHRMDLRILYKPSKRSTISLDVQNVYNRENDAFYYFEPIGSESRLQTQLGLIPILGWRVDW